MSKVRVLAAALLVVFATLSIHAEEKEDTVTTVLKSAGAKGGEIAVKLAAGFFYDTDCKGRNIQDPALGYVCKILGSVSGRTEDEWKENVTKQLDQISSKLDTIENGQKQIQKELTTQYKVMDARFKQVSGEVIAGTNLVRIEGLWEKFESQFDKVDADVTRDAMLSFANEIMKSKPHTIMADLNVVLTKPVLDGQPLIRYPFYEWRLKNEQRMIHELKTMELYEFAENKFADFRMRQEKAYLMYMWAASVLDTQCNLRPQQCVQPPRPRADVQADYERYTRQQIETFNASVDWFILNYSVGRTGLSGNFITLPDAQAMLRRANYLTAATLDREQGLWGRVVSMGNRWDGTLQVSCGGAAQSLKPVLKYNVPVSGNGFPNAGADSGPFDWWVSTKGDGVYDEAHFANDWQMYQYNLPTAPVGPCTIAQNQAGYLPWVQQTIPVVTVTTADERTFPFGSFVGIQRAGGSYALLSGSNWSGSTEPERIEDGPGQREKVTYEWLIDSKPIAGPRIGLYMKGRGEYKVKNFSSRIHNRNRIVLASSKAIRFPDDRAVKLHFIPGNCDKILCSEPGSNGLLSYDIENNDTDSKKGKLDALAGIFFRPAGSDPNLFGNRQGVIIDASYDKTGDRKTKKVTGNQTAVVNPAADKAYSLTYGIYFDLETEGSGINATEYMYSALLGTAAIYLTK